MGGRKEEEKREVTVLLNRGYNWGSQSPENIHCFLESDVSLSRERAIMNVFTSLQQWLRSLNLGIHLRAGKLDEAVIVKKYDMPHNLHCPPESILSGLI